MMGVVGGANTFLTRNRLSNPKSGFSQTLLFFLWFSIVSYNNYGGDSKTLFQILFLVCRLIVISVATDGSSTGDARESDHLFGRTKLMCFFSYFSFSFFLVCIFYLFFYNCIVYSSLFLYLE